jgi:arginine deiminase
MVEDMTSEVKEKDAMINLLKADLATVSKLHRSISSVGDSAEQRIKELEDRVDSKSLEAEEAVDRLLDEMQKNKRLSNMVETLKIKYVFLIQLIFSRFWIEFANGFRSQIEE